MARYIDANSANYLDCGDTAATQITGLEITVALWCRPLATGTGKYMAKWGVALNTHEWLITEATSQWSVWTQTSGSPSTYSNAVGGTVYLNRWQHVVLHQNAAALKLFVDGIQRAESATARTINNTANRVLIGRGEDGAPANAHLAHAALWDTALSRDEIARLAAGASPRIIRPSSLRGYWPLAPEYGSARDLSAYANHAAMNGTVKPVTTTPVHLPGLQLVAAGELEGILTIEPPFIAATTTLFPQGIDRAVYPVPLRLRWARN